MAARLLSLPNSLSYLTPKNSGERPYRNPDFQSSDSPFLITIFSNCTESVTYVSEHVLVRYKNLVQIDLLEYRQEFHSHLQLLVE
jgi:hypothetical protein